MIPQIFAAIIIVIVLCRWYEIKSIDDKLKWMLRIPGLPLIGNALELGKATGKRQKKIAENQNKSICFLRKFIMVQFKSGVFKAAKQYNFVQI
ncbi:hypothetical protein NQ318_002616 [Aromia moschata]|uniref:Cytochrome P450 n=1 Tax=Aromia moschata TaxID=1265417 RepID=A0AAV8XX28_9CUCU|nr:hypothetical protein NQ318_002616 [Aromia moschata]